MRTSNAIAGLMIASLLLLLACGCSSNVSGQEAARELPSTDIWAWPQTWILGIDFDLDRETASSWLPTGLTLAEPPTGRIFVADYPNSQCCGPYYETAVLMKVVHQGAVKVHCLWMLVDDDVALILGRETLGFPKKMGEISLDVTSDSVRAMVTREETVLIDATGRLGADLEDPPPLLGGRFANVWGAYSPLSFGLTPLPRLMTFATAEEILEAKRVDLDLQLRGSVGDPLDQLGLGSVRSASLYRTNMGAALELIALWDDVTEAYVGKTYHLRHGKVESLAPGS